MGSASGIGASRARHGSHALGTHLLVARVCREVGPHAEGEPALTPPADAARHTRARCGGWRQRSMPHQRPQRARVIRSQQPRSRIVGEAAVLGLKDAVGRQETQNALERVRLDAHHLGQFGGRTRRPVQRVGDAEVGHGVQAARQQVPYWRTGRLGVSAPSATGAASSSGGSIGSSPAYAGEPALPTLAASHRPAPRVAAGAVR